ncbi:MAG TPA: hypothetical protein VNJ08_17135 [Bacteriovoracaceae bacterium]|nr:hypothetical protein [Bacteriovoracaceae bacterium]
MNFFEFFRSSDTPSRRNLIFLVLAYFSILFNYPMIRASSTTFFFEAFGAKSSPTAWLWGVIFLSITVFCSNALQSKFSVQKVFFIVSTLSFGIFLISTLAYQNGMKNVTYIPFIWKEIYIVLQIHLLLGYVNNCFKKKDFKLLIGIVGGIGSLGGILGGWVTSFVADRVGTYPVMWIGLVFVMVPALIFMATKVLPKEDGTKSDSPIASFTPEITRYVAIIASIVALSQFIINIADFNFHLAFERTITESSARTSYLGNIFMLINLVTFVLQFLVLPFVMLRVSERNYHIFIPLSYLGCLSLLLVTPYSGVIPYAIFFIYLKASDYSLFSAGKEILYQPLGSNQKYGAKYLTDMLVYRIAKAMIAAVLIYVQTSTILNTMMTVFLLVWTVLVIHLFKLHRQLFT